MCAQRWWGTCFSKVNGASKEMFTAGVRVVLVAGTIEANDPIWCDLIEYVKKCYLLNIVTKLLGAQRKS